MDSVAKARSFREYYRGVLERYEQEIENALPSHIPAKKFIEVALIYLTNRPHLFACEKGTVIGAIMSAAKLGLLIDDQLGEAYITDDTDTLTKKKVAQIIIGYQGFVTLAMRSGFVDYIQPRTVHAGDDIDYSFGLSEKLDHVPLAKDRSDATITHFYVVIKLKSGSKIFDVKMRSEIEEIRDNIPHYKNAPNQDLTFWGMYFKKMGLKSCLRDPLKYIPLSPEMAFARSLDEVLESGVQDLGREVLALPGVDEVLDAEVLEATVIKNQEKQKQKTAAKTSEKVDKAKNNLKDIISRRANG